MGEHISKRGAAGERTLTARSLQITPSSVETLLTSAKMNFVVLCVSVNFRGCLRRFAPAIIAAVVAMWCAVRAASTVLACLNMASSSSHASVMLASSRLESTFHQHQVEGFCLVCLGVAVSFFPRRCRRLAKTGIVLVWHGHFGLFASLPGG